MIQIETFPGHLVAFLETLGIAALALDAEACTVSWNREFLRFFPEHAGHIHLGEPYAENLRRFYRARLDAAEMADIDAYVADGVERHRRQHEPFEFLHRGRWVRVAVLPLPGRGRLRAWAPIHPSYHGDRLAAQMAHSGRQLVAGLMEQIADGLMIRDAAGRIIHANWRLAEIYGLPSPGLAIDRIFPEVLDLAWGGAAHAREARRSWADNSRFAGAPFEVPLPGDRWVRVRDHHSHDGGSVSTHVDVTDLVRLQRSATEAQSRAEELAAQLRAEMEERKRAEARTVHLARLVSIGEMATGLAHELNQPLCALALAADTATVLLQRRGADGIPAALRGLEDAAANAVRARGIVDHLRLHGRAEDETAAPEPVDLARAVQGAMVLTEAAIRSAGIVLEVTLPAEPPVVMGRLIPLQQVILNLLLNARDAVEQNRPAGGIVRVRLERQGGTAVLTVADNGGGFTEAALERAFEPFFTTKPAGKGTGIGLSMAYSAIQAARGIMSLSNADGGAVVCVRLPCLAAAT